MAYPDALVFGLREVKIYDPNVTSGVSLPVARILRVSERVASENFLAEGIQVGVQSFTERLDWELEAGGISLAAWSKLTGRALSQVGSTPNRTQDIVALGNAAVGPSTYPYIRIWGRSVGDAGDDVFIDIMRAKVTALSGEFRDTQFVVTRCAGVGVRDNIGRFYRVQQRETAAVLP